MCVVCIKQMLVGIYCRKCYICENRNTSRTKLMKATTLLVSAAALVLSVVSCDPFKKVNADWVKDPANNYVVHLVGEVKGFDAVDATVEYPEISDLRFGQNIFKFITEKDHFEADVPLRKGESYMLSVYKGRGIWATSPFFADQDTVRIIFDDEAAVYHTRVLLAKEGANREYQLLNDDIAERFGAQMTENERLQDAVETPCTEEFLRLEELSCDESLEEYIRDTIDLTRRQMIADSSAFVPEYKALLKVADQIRREVLDYKMDYLQQRKPSIASLRIVYESIQDASWLDYKYADWVQLYARRYSNQFTDSKLHDAIRVVQERANVHEGMPFSDFSLPDKDGKEQKLSELIAGKYAILEFWATWCSGCIKNRRNSVRPVFEKYKDRGLVVIEVAREYKTDQEWRDFIAKENVDWVELLAMEENHSVGAGYGMSQQTGGVFLIGPDGTVLKVDPTREEMEAVLAEI